ncbi:MAG TPA: hypothetical protein VJJ51_10140 [Candidatus Methanoperedens sp.]|nr:hypothetical protein [Candidatus Methanoperedens sp.]HLB71390.1 hypothetical protein [Candidatus Methanoperedens sp.]
MAKGMDEAKEICGRCKQINNEEVFMVEKHDMLVCPKCQTSFFIKGKSPLERYKENWNNNADEIFVLVRPELSQGDLVNPRLFFLYEDCYHTILIGRYNASIIMMGVLLETLMKERINLKLGGYFEGEYGPCLKKIKVERLMDAEDIVFLRWFKNEVRNPYQHANEAEILQGVLVPVWPIQFEGEISLEKLSKAIKDTKSGRLKPKLLPAAEIPAFRSIAKQAYDRKRAIELFNQVYDFLLGAKIKYFKQEEYDEHNKKFGTGLENVEHYKV